MFLGTTKSLHTCELAPSKTMTMNSLRCLALTLSEEGTHVGGVHLSSDHPVVLAFHGADSAIDVHELALVPIAHHRSCGRGRPAAPDSDHASEACFVLEHQTH